MVSSKGKPTDPKLREEAKEGMLTHPLCAPISGVTISFLANAPSIIDVKQMPNKDGGGKGQMAAWKVSPGFKALLRAAASRSTTESQYHTHAAQHLPYPSFTNALMHSQAGKISEEYEKRGGGYENEPGSKNEPTKGAPTPKSDAKKDAEVKEDGGDEEKTEEKEPEKETEKEKEKEKEKPKANSGKKATGNKKAEPKARAPAKEKKPPTEGTRKSSRVAASAGTKRSAPPDDEEEEEEEEKKEKKKAPAKKAKTAAKK